MSHELFLPFPFLWKILNFAKRLLLQLFNGKVKMHDVNPKKKKQKIARRKEGGKFLPNVKEGSRYFHPLINS